METSDLFDNVHQWFCDYSTMTIRENGMECDDYIVQFEVNYKDVIFLNGNIDLMGAYIRKYDLELMVSGMHPTVTRLFDMAQIDSTGKPMWIRNQYEEFYQEVTRSIKFCYFYWSCQVVIQELGVGSKCFSNQPVLAVQTRRAEPLHQIINYKDKSNRNGKVRVDRWSSARISHLSNLHERIVAEYCIHGGRVLFYMLLAYLSLLYDDSLMLTASFGDFAAICTLSGCTPLIFLSAENGILGGRDESRCDQLKLRLSASWRSKFLYLQPWRMGVWNSLFFVHHRYLEVTAWQPELGCGCRHGRHLMDQRVQYDGRHSNDEKSITLDKPEVSEIKE
nr:hypothetical protein [Tanacetum cinerariifolium]